MDWTEKNFLGKYLKGQREQLGKTVREMAGELNVRPIELSDVEKGNRLPRLEMLQDMKKLYGIENDFCIEFLLNRQEKAAKKTPVKEQPPKVVICYARDKDKPFSTR